MMQVITNIETGKRLYFSAKTPYEAMTMLKYYLQLKDKRAEKIAISKTETGNFLYLIYKGETYCVRN